MNYEWGGGAEVKTQQKLICNAKLKYSCMKRLDMLRCNVSYRLIGGRVSLRRAPLTFSHLTMEGTCYICLRPCGCARNS